MPTPAPDRYTPEAPCPLTATCVLTDTHPGDCAELVPPCPTCGARGDGVPTYRPTRGAPLPASHRAAVTAYLESAQR